MIRRPKMANPAEVGKALKVIPEITSLEELVKGAAKEISKSVPAQIRPERITQIALTCVRTNPELAKCTPASFLGALFVSAQLGIEPIAGEAYILPFNNNRKVNGQWQTIKEAQFILGYRGISTLFYRHAKSLSLSWGVVREGDDFDYEYGTGAYLRHKPGANKGEVRGYYVMASLQGGDKPFLYMTKEACYDHGRKHSKTYDKKSNKFMDSSPWVKEFDAMAKKTVLIQLSKTLPLSTELQRAIQADETSREYREGIDNALDIPPVAWDSDIVDVEPEVKLLEMNSPLHKAIEAMVGENKWDRDSVHEYLLQKGKIAIVDGKPSFGTMTEEDARNWLDKKAEFAEAYQAWLVKEGKAEAKEENGNLFGDEK
jgi:recombination protein RecT